MREEEEEDDEDDDDSDDDEEHSEHSERSEHPGGSIARKASSLWLDRPLPGETLPAAPGHARVGGVELRARGFATSPRDEATLLRTLDDPPSRKSARGSTRGRHSFVQVPSARRNLRALALALCQGRPVLLEGPAGCGKSAALEAAAEATGNADFVTLHLDAQTDSKSLLGAYVVGAAPGEFRWRPGALTRAVEAGRWVVIEDVDQAPHEVLAALAPLLEERRLYVPGRGESIDAADGFQLVGTCTTGGGRSAGGAAAAGARADPLASLWARVAVEPPSGDEPAEILLDAHPSLAPLAPAMLATVEKAQRACGRGGADEGDSGGGRRPVGSIRGGGGGGGDRDGRRRRVDDALREEEERREGGRRGPIVVPRRRARLRGSRVHASRFASLGAAPRDAPRARALPSSRRGRRREARSAGRASAQTPRGGVRGGGGRPRRRVTLRPGPPRGPRGDGAVLGRESGRGGARRGDAQARDAPGERRRRRRPSDAAERRVVEREKRRREELVADGPRDAAPGARREGDADDGACAARRRDGHGEDGARAAARRRRGRAADGGEPQQPERVGGFFRGVQTRGREAPLPAAASPVPRGVRRDVRRRSQRRVRGPRREVRGEAKVGAPPARVQSRREKSSRAARARGGRKRKRKRRRVRGRGRGRRRRRGGRRRRPREEEAGGTRGEARRGVQAQTRAAREEGAEERHRRRREGRTRARVAKTSRRRFRRRKSLSPPPRARGGVARVRARLIRGGARWARAARAAVRFSPSSRARW